MFFRRFYDDQLAQASYLLGCQATGEALVVDPNRHIEPYLRARRGRGPPHHPRDRDPHPRRLRLRRPRAGATRTGARLLLSDEGGDDWRYRYAAEAGAHAAATTATGSRSAASRCRSMHTPGHTPEHLMFLVTDTARGDRADGRAHRRLRLRGRRGPPGPARARGAAWPGRWRPAARQLFRSLQRLAPAAGLPADLARPRRRVGVRQGARRGAAVHARLRAPVQLGLRRTATRTSSCARCSPGQPEPPRYFARDEAHQPRRPPRARRPAGARRGSTSPRDRRGARRRRDRSSTRGPRASFVAQGDPGHDQHSGRPRVHHVGRVAAAVRPRVLTSSSTRDRPHGVDDLAASAGRHRTRPRGRLRRRRRARAWRAGGRALQTIPAIGHGRARRQALTAGSVALLDVRSRGRMGGGPPAGRGQHSARRARRVGWPSCRAVGRIVVHCQTGARAAIAASLLYARGRTRRGAVRRRLRRVERGRTRRSRRRDRGRHGRFPTRLRLLAAVAIVAGLIVAHRERGAASPPSSPGSTDWAPGDRWRSSPATRWPPWRSCRARCSRSPRVRSSASPRARRSSSSPPRSAHRWRFLVARYLARGPVERRLAGNERFAAIDRAIGPRGIPEDRAAAPPLPVLPVQPAQLRAGPHQRSLRRLRSWPRRDAARHAALRVLRQGGWRRRPAGGRCRGPRGPAYYAVLILGLLAVADCRHAGSRAVRAARFTRPPMAVTGRGWDSADDPHRAGSIGSTTSSSRTCTRPAGSIRSRASAITSS